MSDPIRTHQDIGQAIQQLRKSKHLTGVELGKLANISQAKISKIETGNTHCSVEEIEVIMNILQCQKTIRQQIVAVIQLATYTPVDKYRPIYSLPNEVYQRESQTQHTRCFLFGTIPALLQTPAYHKAILIHWKVTPLVIKQKMNEVMKRQDLLWDTAHAYHFILPENALYTIPGTVQIQRTQLDRIDRISSLPNVKIGILPVEVGLSIVENTNFILYDQKLVVLIVNNQELSADDPQDIAEHVKIFNEYSKKAHYNQEARAILQKAIDYFQTS